jgi:hypothetical protein
MAPSNGDDTESNNFFGVGYAPSISRGPQFLEDKLESKRVDCALKILIVILYTLRNMIDVLQNIIEPRQTSPFCNALPH